MAPVAMGSVPPVDRVVNAPSKKKATIEENSFLACLVCLDGHFTEPRMGPLTKHKVGGMLTKTLEKTHTVKDVREALSRNVEIWIYLTKIFAAAVPFLTARSVGPLSNLHDPDKGTFSESNTLMLANYEDLKTDLYMLNKVMHVARNLLVTSEPAVPQDICAAVNFDQMVYQTIILCVNVSSKGFEGDALDDASRTKLNDINSLYKKLLITSLQQAHNWTAKNDRNKMSFWSDVLFDDEAIQEDDDSCFRVDIAKVEVQHWLERNAHVCPTAKALLLDYAATHQTMAPGIPSPMSALAGQWVPGITARVDNPQDPNIAKSVWNNDEVDKFKQDQAYGRVSHEIDLWWETARDKNYEGWDVPMPSTDFAQARYDKFMNSNADNADSLYGNTYLDDDDHAYSEEAQIGSQGRLSPQPGGSATRDQVQEYIDDMEEEDLDDGDDDVDDNESYGDGPMTGILTEIPNILDPNQIEALHMIIKSCILDAVGSGNTVQGENLQKTRCKMLLALECGRTLLREILVFIAVWEKDEDSLVFEITTQIVEALHSNALVPEAWHALRIPKDVISPAQAVLLRLINHMFRKKYLNAPPPEKQDELDIKLAHYLFSCFRSSIVPECLSFMGLQANVRRSITDPIDFPIDNWDMERAKDGLAQVLDFFITISEIDSLRGKLVEWEATFELLSLLKSLESGVPKKGLVDAPRASSAPVAPVAGFSATPGDHAYSQNDAVDQLPPPPPPPPQEPAHAFPWAGIKVQVLAMLANLLQPEPGKLSPGNKQVQDQIMNFNGMMPLLSCCTFDDHNPFARERVQLCLKYLTDGSTAAQDFLRNLVATQPPPQAHAPSAASGSGSTTTSLRIDGVDGEVKVQVQARPLPAPAANIPVPRQPQVTNNLPGLRLPQPHLPQQHAQLGTLQPPVPPASGQPMPAPSFPPGTRDRNDGLLQEIVNLANEAAKMTLAHDGNETEEEDDEGLLSFLSSRRFREHFRQRLVHQGLATTTSDESCNYFERALIYLTGRAQEDEEMERSLANVLFMDPAQARSIWPGLPQQGQASGSAPDAPPATAPGTAPGPMKQC